MNLTDKLSQFFKFPVIDSTVKVYLYIDGQEFQAEKFKIEFNKPIDDKGEPEGETRGGLIVVGLTQTVNDDTYNWILGSGKRKNGMIMFRNQISNAPLKIEFFDAACIHFSRMTCSNRGVLTTITISPERVLLNNVEHDNFWV